MRGVLLRSGRSEDFTALGETGQPVYRAALQIREAIRRKYPEHPGLVEHLAIPQSDERGSTLDWYSERPGDVIPWTSATEEERAPARAQLEVLKTRINDLSNSLLGLDASGQPLPGSRNNAQGDTTVFGKLLTCVIPFPDENFVYLVDGRPVLTFWGFVHAGAERGREPLYCLYPKATKAPEPIAAAPVAPPPPPVTPVAPAPVVPVTPWWRRWWWLLPLLLLLLLLLLFGLRRCAPEVVAPTNDWPTTTNKDIDLNKGNGSIIEPGNTGNGLGTSGTGTGSTGTGSGDLPQGGEVPPGGDQGSPSTDTPPDQTPAPEPQAPAPEPQPEPQPEPAPAPPTPPKLPGDQPPASAQNLLSIPPGAANGNADFLNGNYAGAGIQEVGTGKPLRLKYDFKDGKGQAVVSRSDGVKCQAPVAAAMNQGQLSINSAGQAACADGSSYDLPQVNCKPGATSAADCSGNYGAEAFPMLMKQAGQ